MDHRSPPHSQMMLKMEGVGEYNVETEPATPIFHLPLCCWRLKRLNDHFVGSFESERVLAFWKERHLQVGDEIQRARARLEFVEGQIEDDKRQANLDRAKLQRMKRRHKRLRSVAVQKYKNSSNAMESKKRVMQAGFDYFRSYAKLVVPGFDWSSITVSDVNKYTQ
ncbi:unnamed protein product [Prunus brigantina]